MKEDDQAAEHAGKLIYAKPILQFLKINFIQFRKMIHICSIKYQLCDLFHIKRT